MQKWILPLGALLLFVINFLNVDINNHQEVKRAEHFNPALARLSSIEKLSAYTDSLASAQNISSTQPEYVVLTEKVISERFYHGFSHYNLNENWVAAISEKILGRGLSSIVKPEDIMKKAKAACSQQAIVMMELFKRKQIDYRKIGFPHHYALEAKVNGNWYFTDPDQEPMIPLSVRMHQNWKGQSDNLKAYYDKKVYTDLDYAFGSGKIAEIGPVNTIPAKNLAYFHSFTRLSSWFSWCLPIIFIFVISRKRKRAKVVSMRRPILSPQLQPRFFVS